VRNLMTRKYVQEYASTSLMFWQMLVAGVVLVPWLFLNWSAPSARSLGLIVLLGVAFTAVSHTLFAASFKNLSAKTASIVATLLPFYGALFGYLIYDETITSRTAVGGAIVLACIVTETILAARGGPARTATETKHLQEEGSS
jgi:drug/metabolite transporter (DMT)-like permease